MGEKTSPQSIGMADAHLRMRRVDRAELRTVIEVNGILGDGTKGDPVRSCRQIWSTDGVLLALDETRIDPTENV